MPFSLTNALSTFMRLMNHVLRDCIGKFVVVYFDEILVYSKSSTLHVGHLRVVLSLLRDHQLYANIEKCTFCVESVIFLGFVVNKSGVHVDPAKIKVIQEWLVPKNVGDIKSFHGLASFYRRFFPNFSTIASPLNELVKKDISFEWGWLRLYPIKLKQINAICGNQPESSPNDQCSCSKLHFPDKHNTITQGGLTHSVSI